MTNTQPKWGIPRVPKVGLNVSHSHESISTMSGWRSWITMPQPKRESTLYGAARRVHGMATQNVVPGSIGIETQDVVFWQSSTSGSRTKERMWSLVVDAVFPRADIKWMKWRLLVRSPRCLGVKSGTKGQSRAHQLPMAHAQPARADWPAPRRRRVCRAIP